MINKNLLYSTGKSSQYSVMTWMREESKNSGNMYMELFLKHGQW